MRVRLYYGEHYVTVSACRSYGASYNPGRYIYIYRVPYTSIGYSLSSVSMSMCVSVVRQSTSSPFAGCNSTGVLQFNSLNASQVAIVTHDYRHIDTNLYSGFLHTRAGPCFEIICHPDSVPNADVFNTFTASCDAFRPGQQFLVVHLPRHHSNTLWFVFYRPLLRTTTAGHQIYGNFNMNSMYMITETDTDTLACAQRVLNGNATQISDWITSLGRVPQ